MLDGLRERTADGGESSPQVRAFEAERALCGLGESNSRKGRAGLSRVIRADVSIVCKAIGHKKRYIAFPDTQNPEVIHDHGWQCETCGKPLNNE
jgi:hypothetical protein